MKTPTDPRHIRRKAIIDKLFSYSFDPNQKDQLVEPILPHLSEIDSKIEAAAPEWPVSKIAKIDLAVLRLALYELMIEKKEPPKVIIDEAVELSKAYGNEHSSQFINGVLGTVLKSL